MKKGDRVAIAMRNMPEWCFAWIAISQAGGICVPLNGWWREKEMEYGLQDSGAKIVFCDEERNSVLTPLVDKLKITLIHTNLGLFNEVVALGEKLSVINPNTLEIPNVNEPQDVACIMYTSGTTGHPKGVTLTHRGVLNQMEISRMSEVIKLSLSRLPGMPPLSSKQPAVICAIPLFHVTASHHVFLSCFVTGRKMVIMYKWDAGKALQLIENEGVTVWVGVPTMVQDLMEHPNFSKHNLSTLTQVGAGGAATPPSQVSRVMNKFKGVSPSNGYGLTETNGATCWNQGPAYVAKPTSCGQPLPIVEAKVVDPDTGKLLGPNQPGELLMKSALGMKGYWNKPEATAQAFDSEGFFRSGDIAKIDEEGFVHILDRAKDIVIRGGENISCIEVEGAFHTHPAVRECAVFSLPDHRLGEVVGVMVMLKSGHKCTADELREHVKPMLAHFKVPQVQDIFFTADPLPRGATGKTQKRDIRAQILQTRAPAKL